MFFVSVLIVSTFISLFTSCLSMISAQENVDPTYLKLVEDANTDRIQWKMSINQGNYDLSHQTIEFHLDPKKETLQQVEYLNPQGVLETLNVTEDRATFDQNIKAYQEYVLAKEAYQEDLKQRQEASAMDEQQQVQYEEAMRLYGEQKAIYDQAIAQYEADYQAYLQEVDNYTSQGLEIPADLVEPQLSSEYQTPPQVPEQPEQSTELSEPLEDPTDPTLEELWKWVYHQPDTDVYMMIVPEAIQSAELIWTTSRAENVTQDYFVSAKISYTQDGQVISYQDDQIVQVENQTTNESSTTVLDETTLESSDSQKNEVTIRDAIRINVGSSLEFQDVIDNLHELPQEWTYQWEEEPNTDKEGQFIATIIVNKGASEEERVNVSYEVIQPMKHTRAMTYQSLPSPSFKVVGNTGQPLAGATFEVYSIGNAVVKTVTSDANGIVTISDLNPAEYIIRQVSGATNAPTLAMSPNEMYLIIYPDGNYSISGGQDFNSSTLTLTNTEKNQISFNLRSLEDNRILTGGKFTLVRNNQDIKYTSASSQGIITFSGLASGSYYVRQDTAGTDPLNPMTKYKYDWHDQRNVHGPITIASDGSVTYPSAERTIYNRINQVKEFSFQVRDIYTNMPLNGMEFKTYTLSGLHDYPIHRYKFYSQVSSDTTGRVRVAGPNGSDISRGVDYYFEPINAPLGYELLESIHNNNELIPSVGVSLGDIVFRSQMQPVMYLNPLTTNLTFHKFDRHANLPLSGAEFSLRKVSNSVGGTAVNTLPAFDGQTRVSDVSGKVTFHNLTYGTYELYEVNAPNGYSRLPYSVRFEVTDTGQDSLSIGNFTTSSGSIDPSELVIANNQLTQINNQLKRDVSFKKIGQQNIQNAPKVPLENVSFELNEVEVDPATLAVTTVGNPQLTSSDSQGTVRFDNLTEGTYQIRETSRSPGYYKEDEVLTFFDVVYNPDTGSLIKTNLYSVLQSDPTQKIDSHLELNQDTGQFMYINQRESYAFQIVDEQGNPIEGAQFKVTNMTDTSDNDLTKTSDDNGRITLNRTSAKPNSEFTITQISTKLGYAVEDKEWTIKVDEYGQVTMVAPEGDADFKSGTVVEPQNGTILDSSNHFTLINHPLKYDFTFKKTGLNDTGLGTAEFRLTPMIQESEGVYSPDNTRSIVTATSSSEAASLGMVEFLNLEPGYYKLEETKVPIGYEAKGDAYQYIHIALDKDNNQLVFNKLQNPNGDLLMRDNITGKWIVPNSIQSDFSFKTYGEAPDGKTYIDPFSSPVIPLAGVKYEMKGTGDLSSYYQNSTSSTSGTVAFPDVKPGVYEIKQVDVPGTHLISEAVYRLTVSENADGTIDKTFTKISDPSNREWVYQNVAREYLGYNLKNPAVIQFMKVKDDLEGLDINDMPPLADATFQVFLYDPSNADLPNGYDPTLPLQTQTSDADGMIEFKDLPTGHIYKVVEKESPLNYEMPERQSARVEIDLSGNVTWLTDSPMPAENWSFVASDGIVRSKNTLNKLEFSFVKDDNYGELLAGAEFTLTEYQDQTYSSPIKSWIATSNEKGEVVFDFQDYLPSISRDENNEAHFKLVESKVPEGYQMNIPELRLHLDSENNFHFNSNDQSQYETSLHLQNDRYVITNDRLEIDLYLTKVDGNHLEDRLVGAGFTLESENQDLQNQPFYKQESGQLDSNTYTFSNLTVGKYKLRETITPVGYIPLNDNPLSIEVKEVTDEQGQRTGKLEIILNEQEKRYIEKMDTDGDGVAGVVVKNYPLHEFPRTGGIGSLLYLIVGLSLMTLAMSRYHRLPTIESDKIGGV